MLSAGIVVSTMLVPQALSYATLARVPPIVGLYTSWVRPGLLFRGVFAFRPR
jgi:MFS superfamily sulfate permease-like transporter